MQHYKHVIVAGVDGAGAFFRVADTPCFDRIFGSGAVTYTALASRPSISAECWGSMLIGVGPEVHKLTNDVVSKKPYPADSPFPSLFRRIRTAMPDAPLGAFCCWSPILSGIMEQDQNVTNAAVWDKDIPRVAGDYIKEKKPAFLFMHFDSPDGVGHHNGYGSPEQLAQIHAVDAFVGEVYDAVVSAGIAQDTLFMLIADHGGTPSTGPAGHGGWTDEEKYVTFAACGRGVRHGAVGEMNVRDLSAIVLYALGIDAPAFDEKGWTSQIPEGLFEDPSIPAYRDISHLTGAAPRRSDSPHTSVPV